MKKLILLLTVFLLTACGQNDDGSPKGPAFVNPHPERACSQWSPVPIGSQDHCGNNRPCVYYWTCTGYQDGLE